MTVSHIKEQIEVLEKHYLTNLLTLIVLIDFLKKHVIPNEKMNKMTAQNIAICFSPCLMWAEERSIKDLLHATKTVKVVMLMIQESEQIFGNSRDHKKLFRSSYLQQKKKSLS